MIEKATDRPLKGLLAGAGITTIFQSSSLTIVTLIGLINASLINLPQAIGVMFGAEIGTTVTAQIVSFDIRNFVFPIIAFGFLLTFSEKKKSLKYAGQAILGFGILFLGMDFMRSGVSSLRDFDFFGEFVAGFSQNPLLGVLVAAVFTAITQSSSAAMGLVIAMASQGLIDLESAIPLVLGANIGTTITGALAAIGASRASKRLSLAHVIFNTFWVAVALLFLSQFVGLVSSISSEAARGAANAHTIFNATAALVSLFFVGVFAKIVKKLIPGKDLRKSKKGTKYIEKIALSNPPVALNQAQKEIVRMSKKTRTMFVDFKSLIVGYEKANFKQVILDEDEVDDIYKEISSFLTLLTEKPISEEMSQRLNSFVHASSDIERISDHICNLAITINTCHEKGIVFSQEAQKEVLEISEKTEDMIEKATLVIKSEDQEIYQKMRKQKKKLDNMEARALDQHLKRLKEKICDAGADIYYVNIIRNLGSISGHTMNVARGVNIKNHRA